MSKRFLALPLLCILACLAAPINALAAIKCWTNKDGVRECGNIVPPEYAQKEVQVINEKGITVEVKERAKTTEELEQEQSARAEEEARIAAEKKRNEKRAAHDHLLLSTYTTEAELLAARDRITDAIDGTIEVTRAIISQLNNKLDGLKRRAASLERAGKPVSMELKDDMAMLDRRIIDKQEYIQNKQQEKMLLIERYEADLNRYHELKNIKP